MKEYKETRFYFQDEDTAWHFIETYISILWPFGGMVSGNTGVLVYIPMTADHINRQLCNKISEKIMEYQRRGYYYYVFCGQPNILTIKEHPNLNGTNIENLFEFEAGSEDDRNAATLRRQLLNN